MSELKSIINEFDIRLSEGEVRDVVDWSDVRDAASTIAKKVHGKVDKDKLKGIITNAKKHKPDSTAAAIELVKNMLQESPERFDFDQEDRRDRGRMGRDRMGPEDRMDRDRRSPEDEMGLDTGDESEFDMDYDDPDMDRDRGEIDMRTGDKEDDDMFAGEKRVDITNKLRAMLQGREDLEGGESDEESELPSLDDLDLDSEDDFDREEDEDEDFDYDAFSDKEGRRFDDEDDERVEFDFGTYK